MDTFTLLIDGDCPLCKREASLLARLDRGRERLRLVDIAAPGFVAERYGVTLEEAMGHIHGVLPDGRLVMGVEAFRRAYAAVGWGWVVAWSRLPVVGAVVDRAYEVFAKHRLRLTGRGCEGACRV